MGLRVGVVTGNHGPEVGGAWTFSATLTKALKTAQSTHAFLILDRVAIGMSHRKNDGLEAIARSERIYLMWLMEPSSAIPFLARDCVPVVAAWLESGRVSRMAFR
jgi:hypothetical protein